MHTGKLTETLQRPIFPLIGADAREVEIAGEIRAFLTQKDRKKDGDVGGCAGTSSAEVVVL